MIELQDICRTYQIGGQSVKAVDAVSLTIETGDFVALRGPSGSGKSSIMNILGCLDRPTTGHYLLGGQDVSTLNERELAAIRNRKIGFVHQNFNLLPRLDALENVELPMTYAGVERKERIAKASQALKKVGLGHRLNHHPVQMSGGEQQRVAIARALVNDAPLILADEPTGNLDSKSSVEIMTILQSLNERGNTIVLVTHEADVAEWAQRSIYFKDGKLAQ